MALTVRLQIAGIRETIQKFKDLPKDANNELRDATEEVSKDLAEKIASEARRDSKQSALIAPTVKAKRDRVPVVEAGGTKRVGSRRVPAYKILFGANFGATYLRQFRPHRPGGTDDYFFYSEVEANQSDIADRWTNSADRILQKWGT